MLRFSLAVAAAIAAFLPQCFLCRPSHAADAIWTPNPLVTIYDGPDYSGENDPNCEIRLAGARNGAFSGQVVVFFKTRARLTPAASSGLELAGGAGRAAARSVISGRAVQVRYALPTGVNGIAKLPAGCRGIFDALADEPGDERSVHSVWVTVHVPADAAPGTYQGKLTVAGREVPVKLEVADWTLPDPTNFTTFVDFMESPESVALRYGVPLWSDRHFELITSCFSQLAKVGNKTLYVPLAAKSNLGNEHTMVRWIKTDREKTFRHDFTPFEKYLDAALGAGMRPRIVVAHVYEDFYGGSQGKGGEGGVLVDLLDPATGAVETMEGPGHNNAIEGWLNYPEDHYKFWKPVCDGMLERMKARGIDEQAFAFGLSRDMMPGKATIENLKKVAPYAGWVSHAHGARFGLHGMRGACCTTVWNARFPTDPAAGQRFYGWNNPRTVLHNDRDIWKPDFPSQLVRSRTLGELNITGQQRGFGRMSADFWPCLKDNKGNMTVSISARFPKSNWVQLNLRQTPYLYPGPNGALCTIRFEMMREGIQECEARIFIEKALLNPSARAKLGDQLAARCQNLLDDRVRALIASLGKGKAEGLIASDGGYAQSDWQAKSAVLFEAAADVARALSAN